MASFSGGKDSTAMVLKLIEKGCQLDEIMYVDMQYEFKEVCDNIQKVKEYIGTKGVKFTILRQEYSIDYLQFEKPIVPRNKNYNKRNGYGWANRNYRWCTNRAKILTINKYLKKYKDYNLIQYIGIAYDEPERIRSLNYPLVQWEMTEQECLEYCYSKGYTFGGVYNYMKRLSCWCCPLQSKTDLRYLYKYHKNLWAKLLQMDECNNDKTIKFKDGKTVKEWQEMFENEEVKDVI